MARFVWSRSTSFRRSSSGTSSADKRWVRFEGLDWRHVDRAAATARTRDFLAFLIRACAARGDLVPVAIRDGSGRRQLVEQAAARPAAAQGLRGRSTHHALHNRDAQHEARGCQHPHERPWRGCLPRARAPSRCTRASGWARASSSLPQPRRLRDRARVRPSFLPQLCLQPQPRVADASAKRGARNVQCGRDFALRESPAAASSSASRSFAGSRRICCCTSLMNSADCIVLPVTE